MNDTLIYRFPNEAIVSKHGTFLVQEKNVKLSGFVVGDFKLDTLYSFQESTESDKKKNSLYFSRKIPKVIDKDEYLYLAKHFLSLFGLFGLSKAVFSRIKKVAFDEKKSLRFFESLEKEYPDTFVYLISSKLFGTWVGATPEVLVQVHGNFGFTMALAGTKKSTETTNWGDKELEEQRLVTEFISDNLEQKKYTHIELNGPYEVAAGPVKHLRTDISFDMGKNNTLKTLELLHPTPAVSGFPQEEALDLIKSLEPHERNLYAGVIGWVGSEKSKLFVNLRCCQIKRGAAYLYLGGGFTKESEPELEWQETENKSKTLLNILQKL